jgi:hypothetical protein
MVKLVEAFGEESRSGPEIRAQTPLPMTEYDVIVALLPTIEGRILDGDTGDL